MAKQILDVAEKDIAKSINDLVQGCARFGSVSKLLKTWSAQGWGPLLFGGFVRDLVLHGEDANPRDIDVVFTSVNAEDFLELSRDEGAELNRFGGLRLHNLQWKVDAWRLGNTWAFQHAGVTSSPENLPRTTFLNVEAIALQCDHNGKITNVYDSGFISSIRTGILDINLECNPYPSLAAVRAIVMAAKLEYSISKHLASYIVHQCTNLGIDQMLSVQKQHYGQLIFDESSLINVAINLNSQLEYGETELSLT